MIDGSVSLVIASGNLSTAIEQKCRVRKRAIFIFLPTAYDDVNAIGSRRGCDSLCVGPGTGICPSTYSGNTTS